MAMENIVFRLKGLSPLLMNNGNQVNPFNKFASLKKPIVRKNAKQMTDEDHMELMRLDFLASLYANDDGPFVPWPAIQAVVRDGAKSRRLGSTVSKGFRVLSGDAKLEYKGPRKPDALWKKREEFSDARGVNRRGQRVIKCRPKFSEWSLDFIGAYSPEIINRDDIVDSLEYAGEYVGLLDYRPAKGGQFGRFAVEVVK